MEVSPGTNRLIHESSPYLRQHATNPVDWYPWGDEALARARREDRVIFLSIGYSACHWCHVMERESFEDPEIARLMNDHFVCIKVDREERPDLDRIYMSAVQMMTGSGGWPLSVFLTPDLKPFFGGTYFPPEDRQGHPGFPRILTAVADAFRTRREEIETGARTVTERIRSFAAAASEGGTILLTPALITAAVENLKANFDPDHGGFGATMKFPQPTNIQILLREWKRAGDLDALRCVRVTLDHMAAGGIYDHIGGGFHRYATEPRWLIPHFEKMLYDNALLAIAYAEGFQATGEVAYARVARETLDYLSREMLSSEGGFYASLDADVGDDEGGFYVWTPADLRTLLAPEDAELFARAYGVEEAGNFEGRTILSRVKDDRLLAGIYGAPAASAPPASSSSSRAPSGSPSPMAAEEAIARRLDAARAILYTARERRPKPARDEKILADWNGLAISAFARAARALEEPRFLDLAGKTARFLLTRMVDASGVLFHAYKDGAGRVPGFLSDHANVLVALVDLYEASGDPEWLREAARIEGTLASEFGDETDGAFHDTSTRHADLIARTQDGIDGAVPPGNAMAILGMIRLARITGEPAGMKRAEQALRAFAGLIERIPAGTTQMCLALDSFLAPAQEVAIVGPLEDERTRSLRAVVDRGFLPYTVLLLGDGLDARGLAGLEGKSLIEGRPAAYVCASFACQAPVTSAEDLRRAL